MCLRYLRVSIKLSQAFCQSDRGALLTDGKFLRSLPVLPAGQAGGTCLPIGRSGKNQDYRGRRGLGARFGGEIKKGGAYCTTP